jgi:hypothetical protein
LHFHVIFKTTDYKKLIRYEWEQPDYDPQTDKFMQRFDENGNFVNLPKPEIVEESISNIDSSSSEYFVEYDSQENKYIIKKKE